MNTYPITMGRNKENGFKPFIADTVSPVSMRSEDGPAMARSSYRDLIIQSGENIHREGLLKTPERAAKAWSFLTSGYSTDPSDILRDAVFEENFDSMVLVKGIEFYSLCEHHLLPFFGKVHVAYIPNGKIVGLSKIPRAVDALARRLQVQERLTKQIAEVIEETLNPSGVAVEVEASHMCMMMRGVEKQNSTTATTYFTGSFDSDPKVQERFFNSLRGNGS
jgi:GTP cyclohydrolase IA